MHRAPCAACLPISGLAWAPSYTQTAKVPSDHVASLLAFMQEFSRNNLNQSSGPNKKPQHLILLLVILVFEAGFGTSMVGNPMGLIFNCNASRPALGPIAQIPVQLHARLPHKRLGMGALIHSDRSSKSHKIRPPASWLSCQNSPKTTKNRKPRPK